jgi:hypothetical protein
VRAILSTWMSNVSRAMCVSFPSTCFASYIVSTLQTWCLMLHEYLEWWYSIDQLHGAEFLKKLTLSEVVKKLPSSWWNQYIHYRELQEFGPRISFLSINAHFNIIFLPRLMYSKLYLPHTHPSV